MIKLLDILKEVEDSSLGNKEAVLKYLQHRISTTYAKSVEGRSLAKIKKEIEFLEGQDLIDQLTKSRKEAMAAKRWGISYLLAKLEDISLGKNLTNLK